MQSFSTAYTVYCNLRHRRHGHLLDGRYKAQLVEGDDYLLALSRYVHLNPVRVGAIKDKPIAEQIRYLRMYPWGTYLSYIGQQKCFDFVEYAPILVPIVPIGVCRLGSVPIVPIVPIGVSPVFSI